MIERLLRPPFIVACVLAGIGPGRSLWVERTDLSPPLPYTLVERITLVSCALLLLSGLLELIRPRVACLLALAASTILWFSFHGPALWFIARHGSFLLLESGGTSWQMVGYQFCASIGAGALTAIRFRNHHYSKPPASQS